MACIFILRLVCLVTSRNDTTFEYKTPGQSMLNTMRCNCTKIVVSDYIAMLGNHSLSHLSCELHGIFHNYSQSLACVKVCILRRLICEVVCRQPGR